MQRTAISNPYFMEAPPRERTPINFRVGRDASYCYGCGRTVLPRIIDTSFLSKPLAVCPHCNSVIQSKPADPKAKKKIRFHWSCFSCGERYPEDARLSICLTDTGITRRVCRACGEIVYFVEDQS